MTSLALYVGGQAAVAAVVASYDAGTAGAAPDPTSAAGGSWSMDSPGIVSPGTVGAAVDLGLPVWSVADTGNAGEVVSYRDALSVDELSDAQAFGWEYSARLRMTSGGSNMGGGLDNFVASVFVGVVLPTGRWDLYVDVDDDGALTLVQFTGGVQTIYTGVPGEGTSAYHDIAVRLGAGQTVADVFLDGVNVGMLADSGLTPDLPAGIRWGVGSSRGDGSAFIRSVELRVVPTPGSVTALVLAGAVPLGRRRRCV